MSDRITGLVGLVFAVVYGVTGASFASRLQADPLGPNAFPVLLAIVLGMFSLALVIRPGEVAQTSPVPWSATVRAAVAVAVMVLYGLILELVGFVIASALLVAALVVLKRGTLLQAGVCGIAASVVLYLLFDPIFGLPLPIGSLLEQLESE